MQHTDVDTWPTEHPAPPAVSLWPRFWVARVCDVYPVAAAMQADTCGDDTVMVPWWDSAPLIGTATAPPPPLKGTHTDGDGEAGG